jgi:hypothetical protein
MNEHALAGDPHLLCSSAECPIVLHRGTIISHSVFFSNGGQKAIFYVRIGLVERHAFCEPGLQGESIPDMTAGRIFSQVADMERRDDVKQTDNRSTNSHSSAGGTKV